MHQDSRNKKHKHILKYDPGKALGWSSIFHLEWSDFKSGIFIRTIILTGIAAALGAVSCRTDDSGSNWSFCLQQYESTDLLVFSTLVSFLLTQFVAQTFSRWWSMRMHLAAVQGRTTDFCRQAIAYVDDSTRGQEARHELTRLMTLAHAMVYKQARKTEDMGDLLEAGVMREEEWAALQPRATGRYVIVLTWLSTLMRKTDHAGLLHQPLSSVWAPSGVTLKLKVSLLILDNTLGIFRQNAADCLVYQSTQIPYIYTRLIGLVTRIHLIFICVLAATWFSTGIIQKSVDKLIYGVLLVFVNSVIYEGICRFHRELYNPFDKYATNFPTRHYWETIRTLTGALMETPPPPRPSTQPPRSSGAGAHGRTRPATVPATGHPPAPPKPDILLDGPTPPTSPPLKPAAWIKDANGAPNGSAPAPPPDPSPGPERPAPPTGNGPNADGPLLSQRSLAFVGFRPVYPPPESNSASFLQPSSAPLSPRSAAASFPVHPVPERPHAPSAEEEGPASASASAPAPAPVSAPAFAPPPPSLVLPPPSGPPSEHAPSPPLPAWEEGAGEEEAEPRGSLGIEALDLPSSPGGGGGSRRHSSPNPFFSGSLGRTHSAGAERTGSAGRRGSDGAGGGGGGGSGEGLLEGSLARSKRFRTMPDLATIARGGGGGAGAGAIEWIPPDWAPPPSPGRGHAHSAEPPSPPRPDQSPAPAPLAPRAQTPKRPSYLPRVPSGPRPPSGPPPPEEYPVPPHVPPATPSPAPSRSRSPSASAVPSFSAPDTPPSALRRPSKLGASSTPPRPQGQQVTFAPTPEGPSPDRTYPSPGSAAAYKPPVALGSIVLLELESGQEDSKPGAASLQQANGRIGSPGRDDAPA
eukprot:tig00021290_g19970.t1